MRRTIFFLPNTAPILLAPLISCVMRMCWCNRPGTAQAPGPVRSSPLRPGDPRGRGRKKLPESETARPPSPRGRRSLVCRRDWSSLTAHIPQWTPSALAAGARPLAIGGCLRGSQTLAADLFLSLAANWKLFFYFYFYFLMKAYFKYNGEACCLKGV